MNPDSAFQIRSIPQSVTDADGTGWASKVFFQGRSPNIRRYLSVVCLIGEGVSPHSVHSHDSEEIILVLSGSIMWVKDSQEVSGDQTSSVLPTGTVVYNASREPHTLIGMGPGPSTLLVIQWEGESDPKQEALHSAVLYPGTHDFRAPRHIPEETLLEGPTRYLERMRFSRRSAQPASKGKQIHRNDYDEIIVLLEGGLRTMSIDISSPTLLFFRAGTPHWICSSGEHPVELMSLALR